MSPKLTEKSKAVQLLSSKFNNGQITGKEKPQEVYESEPEFQKYSKNSFCTKFHKIRKELEAEKCAEEPMNDGLNRFINGSDLESCSKKRRVQAVDLSDEEEFDLEGENEESNQCDVFSFKPLHIISEWKEPGTMTKCLSVAIILPSGIGEGAFASHVVENGGALELSVVWPPQLLEPVIMHKKWLNKDNREGFEIYHPKVVGFELALKQLRKRSGDLVESFAKINLPFAVQAHVRAQHNMAWRDSTVRMVYLDLMGVVEEYAHSTDKKAFEVVE